MGDPLNGAEGLQGTPLAQSGLGAVLREGFLREVAPPEAGKPMGIGQAKGREAVSAPGTEEKAARAKACV